MVQRHQVVAAVVLAQLVLMVLTTGMAVREAMVLHQALLDHQ
jgi:hypothetical protein